jgi:ABC-type bacteriocin/lantibiotic exporter with double-glycine peptidase domain
MNKKIYKAVNWIGRHFTELWPALTADETGSVIIQVPGSYQRDSYSCTACCLHSIAKYYGMELSRDDAKRAVDCDPEYGASISLIAPALTTLGLNMARHRIRRIPFLYRRAIRRALDAGKVVSAIDIETYVEAHSVLIIGYNDDGYWVMDPCLPYRKFVPSHRFGRYWNFSALEKV